MNTWVHLEASDGHRLAAYRAYPAGKRVGGLVVIQEVFGVNAHIRSVCDSFAAKGYEVIAPALFDRVREGVELGYDQAGIEEGRSLVGQLGWENPVSDVWAAATHLHPQGQVCVVGYCWGGTVTWLAASRLGISCAAAYYGRQIVEFPEDHPRCPLMAHFGADDALIPLASVERVGKANPDVPIYLYPGAGHGFNCDARADYRPDASALALERTLELFSRTLAGVN